MSVDLLDWAAPGPYRVAFSTRLGGISEGEFESLNLGILTKDDPARVVVNRMRLCNAVGADPDGATITNMRPLPVSAIPRYRSCRCRIFSSVSGPPRCLVISGSLSCLASFRSPSNQGRRRMSSRSAACTR